MIQFMFLSLSVMALAAEPQLNSIKLPAGFEITYYAADVDGARSMTLSPSGVLYVGSQDGKVYAVVDKDHDKKADEVHTIASGLNQPNGVAYRDGSLYVAEINRIIRFDSIEKDLKNPPKPIVVYDRLPKDTHHGWKFIKFGPDGWLYVPVGAPCNICDSGQDKVYASILRLKPDGSVLEHFAKGIRNTVGFDWHPTTKELWFTDNGRDWLGDDKPGDELNHAPKKDLHFGYPYCHNNDIKDPEFGKDKDCSKYTSPARVLDPHVAALGMRFYNGDMFPKEYKGQIIIAEHGSWNRTSPIGYRLMLVKLKDGKAVSYEPFAEGWLQGRKAWGRPVDVETMSDGSLLVSDDSKGAIYRITYKGKK